MTSAETMRIGEVAERAGVNVQTLRYYERLGLLPSPARRPSGYREYSPDIVAVVRFIKRAQHLGFNLEDIAELLELREHPGRSKAAVRSIAVRRVADITERIQQLTAMQQALEQLVTACECAGASRECPIIEALDDNSSHPRGPVSRRHSLSGGTHARR